jgi:protein ImuB
VPLALVAGGQGGVRVVAVDDRAAAEGIAPGLTLADARAILPGLRIADAAPQADRMALAHLAEWADRFSPTVALDPAGDGLWLDIAGTERLFGDAAALAADLIARLMRMGIAACAAVAPTPGAAWALAHHGDGTPVLAGGMATALAPLPPEALRLPPEMAVELRRLGLKRIEQLYGLPRSSLMARFGEQPWRRLDQALGRAPEALLPHRPPPRHGARLAWPAPIGRTEDVAAAIRHLSDALCQSLEAAGEGAARLVLALHLADGQTRRLAVGCSRPSRAPDHLARLFAEKLDGLDIGFGVEAMTLDATESVPQTGDDDASLGLLVDRLGNRLGAQAVGHLVPQASHVPERAQRWSPGLAQAPRDATWLAGDRPRPIRLLLPPERVEAVAEVPDGPPVQFRWRTLAHRVRRVEGPERIAPEWWRSVDPHAALDSDAGTRDYFRVEDEDGRRFWLYRDGLYAPGANPTWYLHGLFA